MNKKKKLLILLGVTQNWAFAAGTILAGINKHLKDNDQDVLIYVDQKNKKNCDSLKSLYPCEILVYQSPFINQDMGKFKRVSTMAFSKFEAFKFLDKYKNVIWIDADALILGNFTDIIDKMDTGIAMYKHPKTPINVSFSKNIKGYNMEEVCYNDGIFIINDNIQNGKMLAKWAYNKTIEYYDYINSDQAIFNLMLQEFDIQVTPLDIKYNCPPHKKSNNTLIIHPWGRNKFWDEIYNPVWEEYYKKWKQNANKAPIVRNKYYKFINYILRRYKIFIKKNILGGSIK